MLIGKSVSLISISLRLLTRCADMHTLAYLKAVIISAKIYATISGFFMSNICNFHPAPLRFRTMNFLYFVMPVNTEFDWNGKNYTIFYWTYWLQKFQWAKEKKMDIPKSTLDCYFWIEFCRLKCLYFDLEQSIYNNLDSFFIHKEK